MLRKLVQEVMSRKDNQSSSPSLTISSTNSTPQQQQRPQFQVLTLGDLPKPGTAPQLGAQYVSRPQGAVEEPQRLTLSNGPVRTVSGSSAINSDYDDDLHSVSGSIYNNGVSPITPATRSNNMFRSGTRKSRRDRSVSPISALEPVPETRRSGLNEDDYEDDPFGDSRSRYRASSFYGLDPFADSHGHTRTFQQRAEDVPALPRIKTNFLSPNGSTPSPRSPGWFTNPFGGNRSPRRSQSPVSPASAMGASDGVRYSDCGVHPLEGLDERARQERLSNDQASNIWDLITGAARTNPRKVAPSPTIHIDTSMLDNNYNQRYSRTLMDARPPQSAVSASSPREWYSNILVDYEGRPETINKALSYYPQPQSAAPPGLSPREITTQAVPYLATLEQELAELRKYKADREAQEKAEDERDRVRDLIQRQLAHEQAREALQRAVGGKPITQQQLQSPNIWTEIDLSAVKTPTAADRRSVETVWPSFDAQSAPPVPNIPKVHQVAASSSKVPIIAEPKPKTLRGLLGWGAKKYQEQEKLAAMAAPRGSPIVRVTNQDVTSAYHVEVDEKPSKNKNILQKPQPPHTQARETRDFFGGAQAPAPAPQVPTPVPQVYVEDDDKTDVADEEYPDEKRGGFEHSGSDTATEVASHLGSPPPYERGAANAPFGGLRQMENAYYPDERKPSGTYLSVSTDPRSLSGFEIGRQFSNAPFTPTSPHTRRASTMRSSCSRGGPTGQMTMNDLASFRSQRPSDKRDRAERHRRHQETRERRMRRGGSLWLCGLCCGPRRMTRRQKLTWCTFITVIVLGLIILGAVLGIAKSNEKPAPINTGDEVKMVTLDNFPSLPVGNVTITPRLTNTVNTCVAPSTMWSCAVPPPMSNPSNLDKPIFSWKIIAKNDTDFLSVSDPKPVLVEEYRNMSKIDGVLDNNLEGEATNFFVTMLQTNTSSKDQVVFKRSHSRHFARQTNMAQLPPAVMLPTYYTDQQLRFFDRGLPTEHYKFVTFFDKTIYLREIKAHSEDSPGNNQFDVNGGVSPLEARFVCRFPRTRFVTKIFTRAARERADGRIKIIVDPTTLAVDKNDNAGGLAGYPVEIEEDLLDYDDEKKNTANCWAITKDGRPDPATMKTVQVKDRRTSTGTRGEDFRGCRCTWNNFKESSGPAGV